MNRTELYIKNNTRNEATILGEYANVKYNRSISVNKLCRRARLQGVNEDLCRFKVKEIKVLLNGKTLKSCHYRFEGDRICFNKTLRPYIINNPLKVFGIKLCNNISIKPRQHHLNIEIVYDFII